MKLKTAVAVLAAPLVLAPMLAACGGGDDGGGEGALPTVTISSLPSLGYSSLFLAAEKYDEQFGVNIKIEIASRGDEIFQDVISGQTNLGGSTGVQAFNAVNQGLPMKYVAPINYAYNEDYFMIAASSKAEAVKIAGNMDQLEGKKVGVSAPGAMTDISLNWMLKKGGLTINDVDVQNIPFTEHPSALASKSIVASATGEPNATIAEDNKAAFRPFDTPTDESQRVLTVILAVNTDWAKKNDATMQKFMNAYQAAAKDLDDNGYKSDDAIAAAVKYTDLDPKLIKRLRLSALPADLNINMDNVEAQQDYLMSRGLLDYDTPMNVEDLFDFTWRDKAVKDADAN